MTQSKPGQVQNEMEHPMLSVFGIFPKRDGHILLEIEIFYHEYCNENEAT